MNIIYCPVTSTCRLNRNTVNFVRSFFVVAALAGVVMWRKYRGSGSSDNNTGVDVNEMYGEDEYYQYTESRHQTSVVDENDYYDNDDDED